METKDISRSRHVRKSSNKKSGTGGYYQFTFEPEFSDSDEEDIYNLSPKEIVERALKDTELDARGPVGVYTDNENNIPEPDFSTEFLNDSRDSLHLQDNSAHDDVSTETDDVRPETPESLYSPLDQPDSGYIEFVHSQSTTPTDSGTARSQSEGFGDHFFPNSTISTRNVPQQDRTKSADDLVVTARKQKSPRRSIVTPKQSSGGASKNLPSVVFRRFKNEFNKLEEDRFIDDDFELTPTSPDEAGEEDLRLGLQHVERKTFCAPPSLAGSSSAQPGNPYMPMSEEEDDGDRPGHGHETMADSERGRVDHADDCRILVEQTTLSRRARLRRRKIIIIIAVMAGTFALAGLGAIIYLLLRFVVLNDQE